jgi:UDP:flavonoid glycosyltransferase YjiC (YdhE family)
VKRVVEMGVGVAPITVKKLTVTNMAAALVKLTSDEKMRDKAADLGKK